MSDSSEPERVRVDAPSPALSSILVEARAAEPSIDWERLESRLFDDSGAVRPELLREARGVERTARGVRVAVVASGLAIAAAFAFALLSPTRAVERGDRGGPAVVAARAPILFDDGRPAVVGARVVGAASGTWLRAQGRVSIRIEPGAIVRPLDDGERVRVALESGAVAADVVPVAGGEPYAVDALGKRVAVHGTHLRVAIVPSTIGGVTAERALEVAVSEGSGVVGAPTEGRTEGTLVPAGAVGSFAGAAASVVVDAERASRLVEGSLASKGAAASPAGDVHATPGATASPIASAEPATKPPAASKPAVAAIAPPPSAGDPGAATADGAPAQKPGLSAAQLEAPLGKIEAALQACAPHKGAGVTSSFATTLTLHVDPQGRVADFKAELDPTMRECFRVQLAKVAFPVAEGSTAVTRAIVLGAK